MALPAIPLPQAAPAAPAGPPPRNGDSVPDFHGDGAYTLAGSQDGEAAPAAGNSGAQGQALWFQSVPNDGSDLALLLGDAANLHIDASGNLLGTV